MKFNKSIQLISIYLGVTIVFIFVVFKKLENMNFPQHIVTEEIDSQEIELFRNDAEEEFKKWLKLQNRIQLNVAKVCKKYRDKLYKLEIPTFPLMFDRNTNLFFCRNAKVKKFHLYLRNV